MSHLIKKADSGYFVVTGKWDVLVYWHGEDEDDDYNYVDEEAETPSESLDDVTLDTANDFARKDFEDIKSIVMKQMQEKCQEGEEITNIDFDLTSTNSHMHIYSNQSLVQETKEAILDIVNGQYSDGWGEGLEQRSFVKEQSEDHGDGVDVEYFIRLWPDNVNLHIE
jgi:hypothetical protein